LKKEVFEELVTLECVVHKAAAEQGAEETLINEEQKAVIGRLMLKLLN